jgi:hypothetical protein
MPSHREEAAGMSSPWATTGTGGGLAMSSLWPTSSGGGRVGRNSTPDAAGIARGEASPGNEERPLSGLLGFFSRCSSPAGITRVEIGQRDLA